METKKPAPKFLVRCNCDELYVCTDEHAEPGMVAAKCDECDEPAVLQLGDDSFLCESHSNPCWKCNGLGCRACGDTGSESTRRVLQNCAELPAFHQDEEPTTRVSMPTNAELVAERNCGLDGCLEHGTPEAVSGVGQ